jgi:hypothetical protein
LSSRRKVLEKKSELRQATLNEFERIKLINTRNTYQELEKQNEDARLRNQKFLNHVNNTVENLAVYRSNQHSSESGECLLQVTHALRSFSYLFLFAAGITGPSSSIAISEKKLRDAIGMYKHQY